MNDTAPLTIDEQQAYYDKRWPEESERPNKFRILTNTSYKSQAIPTFEFTQKRLQKPCMKALSTKVT